MEPIISVIVPVFNSEPFLKQCLDSICAQTYESLQIICVDDNSTDHSWAILEEYASKDSRFVICQKPNEGVSLARNYGLDRATGEYILFVDSDDWIDPETAEQALRSARDSSADVVMWSYIREMGSASREKRIFEGNVLFDAEAVRDQLYRRMIGPYGEEIGKPENADALCTVWGKLYRSELIQSNQIRFYDIRKIGTYEDGLFNLNVFAHTGKAMFLDRCFYHYRRNVSASLTTAYKPMLPQQWSKLFGLLEEHMDSHGLEGAFRKALENRIALSLISLGINEMESDGSWVAKVRRIRQLLADDKRRKAVKTLELKGLPIHWKAFFAVARMNWAAGVYCMLLAIQKIRGR